MPPESARVSGLVWRKVLVAVVSALAFSLLLYEFTSTFWLGANFRYVTEGLIALLAGSVTGLACEFARAGDRVAGKSVRWAFTLVLAGISLFALWQFYLIHTECVKLLTVDRDWWVRHFDERGPSVATNLATNTFPNKRELPETTTRQIPAFLNFQHSTIFMPENIPDTTLANIMAKYEHRTGHTNASEAIQWSLNTEPMYLIAWATTAAGTAARNEKLFYYMLWQICTIVFLSAAWGTCPGKLEVASDVAGSNVVDQLARIIKRP